MMRLSQTQKISINRLFCGWSWWLSPCQSDPQSEKDYHWICLDKPSTLAIHHPPLPFHCKLSKKRFAPVFPKESSIVFTFGLDPKFWKMQPIQMWARKGRVRTEKLGSCHSGLQNNPFVRGNHVMRHLVEYIKPNRHVFSRFFKFSTSKTMGANIHPVWASGCEAAASRAAALRSAPAWRQVEATPPPLVFWFFGPTLLQISWSNFQFRFSGLQIHGIFVHSHQNPLKKVGKLHFWPTQWNHISLNRNSPG